MSITSSSTTRPKASNLIKFLAMESREAKAFSVSTRLSSCSGSLTPCNAPVINSLVSSASVTSNSVQSSLQIQCPHCSNNFNIAVVRLDNNNKDGKEIKDNKESKNIKENKNHENNKEDKEYKESKNINESRENKENKLISEVSTPEISTLEISTLEISTPEISTLEIPIASNIKDAKDIKKDQLTSSSTSNTEEQENCDKEKSNEKDFKTEITRDDHKIKIEKVKSTTLQVAEFQKFNPSKLKRSISLIIGNRNTGKTILAASLAKSISTYCNDIIVFSCTPAETMAAEVFNKALPESNIIYCYQKNEEFISTLTRIVEYQKLFPDNKVLIVFDDFGAMEKKTRNSEIMKFLFKTSRHYGISIIFTITYIKDLTQELRNNADYHFFLHTSIYRDIKVVFDTVTFRDEITYQEFNQIYQTLTGNYGALIYDHTTTSSSITEKIKWYKAELI